MYTSESNVKKPAPEATLPSPLAKEIERALEIMRRVRTAQSTQEKGEALETTPGNKYELPEPPVLRVGGSTERH
jgi:hypothetical protein